MEVQICQVKFKGSVQPKMKTIPGNTLFYGVRDTEQLPNQPPNSRRRNNMQQNVTNM